MNDRLHRTFATTASVRTGHGPGGAVAKSRRSPAQPHGVSGVDPPGRTVERQIERRVKAAQFRELKALDNFD